MMLPTLEVVSGFATGSLLGSLDLVSASTADQLDNSNTLSAVVRWPTAVSVRQRSCLRFTGSDGVVREYRVRRVARDSTNRTLTIDAVAPWLDLATAGVVQTVTGGATSLAIAATLSAADWLSTYVLTRLDEDGLGWLDSTLGTMEATGTKYLTFTGGTTRLAILQAVATAFGMEWTVTQPAPGARYRISLVAQRGAAAGAAYVAALRNLIASTVDEDDQQAVSHVVALGGVPQGATEPATIGDNLWRVGAISSGWVRLDNPSGGPPAVAFDDMLNGLTVLGPMTGTTAPVAYAIVDSRASDGSVLLSSTVGLSVGSLVSVRRTADGAPLVELSMPTAAATLGRTVAPHTVEGGRGEANRVDDGRFANDLTRWSPVVVVTPPAYAGVRRADLGKTLTFAANGTRAAWTSTSDPFVVDGLPPNERIYQGDVITQEAASLVVASAVIPSGTGALSIPLTAPTTVSFNDNDLLTFVRRETVTWTLDRARPSFGSDGCRFVVSGPLARYLAARAGGANYDTLITVAAGSTNLGTLYNYDSPLWATRLLPWPDDASKIVLSTPGGAGSWARWVLQTAYNEAPTVPTWTGTGATTLQITVRGTNAPAVGQFVDLTLPRGAAFGDNDAAFGAWPHFRAQPTVPGSLYTVTGTVTAVTTVAGNGLDYGAPGYVPECRRVTVQLDMAPSGLSLTGRSGPVGNGVVLTTDPADLSGVQNIWAYTFFSAPLAYAANSTLTVTIQRETRGLRVDGSHSSGATTIATKANTGLVTADVLDTGTVLYWFDTAANVERSVTITTPGFTPTWDAATGQVSVPVTIPTGWTVPFGTRVWLGGLPDPAGFPPNFAVAQTVVGPASSLSLFGYDGYPADWNGTTAFPVGLYRLPAGATATLPGNVVSAASSVQADGAGNASIPIREVHNADIPNDAPLRIVRPSLLGPSDPTTGSVARLLYAVGGGNLPSQNLPGLRSNFWWVTVPAGQTRTVTVYARVAVTAGSYNLGQWPALAVLGADGAILGSTRFRDASGTVGTILYGTMIAQAVLTSSRAVALAVYGGASTATTQWQAVLDAWGVVSPSTDVPYVDGSHANALWAAATQYLAVYGRPVRKLSLTVAQLHALTGAPLLPAPPAIGQTITNEDTGDVVRLVALRVDHFDYSKTEMVLDSLRPTAARLLGVK